MTIFFTFVSIKTNDDNKQLTKTNISSSTFINYNLINNLIRNEYWSESLNKSNVNKSLGVFNDKINEFIKSATKPISSKLTKNKSKKIIKKWITSGIITSIRHREKLFSKKTKNPTDKKGIIYYNQYRN